MNTSLPAKWFRMYAEFANDPKVQMLSEADQRRFVMLLCMRCANGSRQVPDAEVCFQLRVPSDEWQATKSILMGMSLIDEHNRPTAWERRQYPSDCSTERVYRHRSNVSETLQKLPVETEKETKTEKREKNGPKPPASHPFALIWNENCGTLAKITKLTTGRLRQCRIRQSDYDSATFQRAVMICARTPFLTGHNDRGWQADFDWLIQNDKNLFKVLEGKYNHNGTSKAVQRERRSEAALDSVFGSTAPVSTTAGSGLPPGID